MAPSFVSDFSNSKHPLFPRLKNIHFFTCKNIHFSTFEKHPLFTFGKTSTFSPSKNIHFFTFEKHPNARLDLGVPIKVKIDVVWKEKVAGWRIFYHFQRVTNFSPLLRIH